MFTQIILYIICLVLLLIVVILIAVFRNTKSQRLTIAKAATKKLLLPQKGQKRWEPLVCTDKKYSQSQCR